MIYSQTCVDFIHEDIGVVYYVCNVYDVSDVGVCVDQQYTHAELTASVM